MRVLRRIVVTFVVLAVLAAGGTAYLVTQSFPVKSGEIEVPGLLGPVEVIRDLDGVPHIYATTTHDLFLAQGYVHAQDRFWQMDFWRHIGMGRTAELFGANQVEADVFLRTMGWGDVARREYERAPRAVREILDSYTAGVNAYLEERTGYRLSFEYAVLAIRNRDYSPEPWSPADSLVWGKVMAWDLRSNLDDEIDRTVLLGKLPAERVTQLYPDFPASHPFSVPDATPVVADVGQVSAALDELVGGSFEGIGSNNWVVAGTKTASGYPLLANDPHLEIQMPSIWYTVGLHCLPKGDRCPWNVAGVGFPGTPGVVIGHNDRIAWGVTNLGADTMDLVVEKVDRDDPTNYELEGRLLPMEIKRETIKVAGDDPVVIEVRRTIHGPVVSGIFADLDQIGDAVTTPEDYVVSLRWRALEPSQLVESILQYNLAGNWDEFRFALNKFDIAGQNFVYADVDGNIGYQATGRVPIRASGDGSLPVPGWTNEFSWQGYVPFSQMPSVFNPPQGFIVTANQPPQQDGPFLGRDFDLGYRADRITNLLQSFGRVVTADDMRSIQMDTLTPEATRIVVAMGAVDSDNADVTTAQVILHRWVDDGAFMAVDSPGAAVFAAAWRSLLASVINDEVGTAHALEGGSRSYRAFVQLLNEPDDPWWDDIETPKVEDRDEALEDALAGAMAELRLTQGDEPDNWRWGRMHIANFRNQSFGVSGIVLIEAIFNRGGVQTGGGSSIVNATGWSAPKGYEVTGLPSMRMVIDLANLGNSTLIHTTGQSGHTFHSHYSDYIFDWSVGRSRRLRFDLQDVKTGAESTLKMLPFNDDVENP